MLPTAWLAQHWIARPSIARGLMFRKLLVVDPVATRSDLSIYREDHHSGRIWALFKFQASDSKKRIEASYSTTKICLMPCPYIGNSSFKLLLSQPQQHRNTAVVFTLNHRFCKDRLIIRQCWLLLFCFASTVTISHALCHDKLRIELKIGILVLIMWLWLTSSPILHRCWV